VLLAVLEKAGYDGASLLAQANEPAVKAKLREATAAAKAQGICGVPTYRILREGENNRWEVHDSLVWGQDETNVVEDLIAGWDAENSIEIAEPRKASMNAKAAARL
jgi:2-hydroxychromene-2-carboxylate isomerase